MRIDHPPATPPEPEFGPDEEPRPTSILSEIAKEVGFEWGDDDALKRIEKEFLNKELTDEDTIIGLIRAYNDRCYELMVNAGQSKPTGNLALMLQLAHLRYCKRRFPSLLKDLEDIARELAGLQITPNDSSNVQAGIEKKTYDKIVAATIIIEMEIAKKTGSEPN